MNRRHFMGLGAAAAAGAGFGLPARAATPSGSELKFLFVFNPGGWDPTRVLAHSALDNGNVDTEASADLSSRGDLVWVDHPDRPSVTSFFDSYADRSLVLNGVQVRSIAHEICTTIAMTGGTSGLTSDWPAILAAQSSGAFTLPHLVLSGPSYPGELGSAVARTGVNGQLEALLSGEISSWTDQAAPGLSSPAQGLVDQYLRRRASGRVASAGVPGDVLLAEAFQEAVEKALAVKDYRYVMDFTGGLAFSSQVPVAVDALRTGLSRCVTLAHTGAQAGLGWDTHADNDDTQSDLWETLFSGLGDLMGRLQSEPGEVADTLADETVVVVMSEMGRTPQLNATNGKDHWPYTSVLVVGPGVEGGRVIGDFDEGFASAGIDLASGEVDEDGPILSVESVGAALLQLGDVDPGDWVSGTTALEGMLS